MGKWTNMKGQLPPVPIEAGYGEKIRARQVEFNQPINENGETHVPTMKNFVTFYNALREEKEQIAEQEKDINLSLEALTNLINDYLQATGSDIWRGSGFSFSEKVEPYASVVDKAAVLEHFIPLKQLRAAVEDHLLGADEDCELIYQLLNRAESQVGILSVPFQTLNAMVKAEAEAGDLLMVESIDDNGEEKTIVTSTIPGVNVFLKTGLNRRKS